MKPICNKNPKVQSKATVPPCYYYLCVPGQRKTYKNTCLLVKLVWGQGPPADFFPTRSTPPPILPFPESKAKCLKRPAQVVGLQQQAHQAGCSPGAVSGRPGVTAVKDPQRKEMLFPIHHPSQYPLRPSLATAEAKG